jgi:hypothetical protein
VRRFTIDSTVLGTSKHIVGDSDGYVWSESVPKDSWHMTGETKAASTVKCLDTLLRLSSETVPQVPDRYLTSLKSLVTGSQAIPWHYVLPQNEFKNYFKNLIQKTTDVFDELPFDYYETVWAAGSRVINSLKPAKINLQMFQSHIEVNPHSPGLESFRPKRSGFAYLVEYDRFSTRTGRFTVSDGPNILVLKKEYKGMIQSSYDDGRIVSLDFKALEARIILAEAGKTSDADDLYRDISEVQFKGIIPRDVVKVAVLAELYGVSKNTLKWKLGLSEDKVDSFIESIKEYFGVEKLKQRLKNDLYEDGHLKNRFGRRLEVPHNQDNLLINTYSQSTGVDVALLGFDKVLSKLGTEGIRPLFVLHDAIILDVRGDRLDDVRACNCVEIPTYEGNFPLKFESITNS